jgi:hypothetical protein
MGNFFQFARQVTRQKTSKDPSGAPGMDEGWIGQFVAS